MKKLRLFQSFNKQKDFFCKKIPNYSKNLSKYKSILKRSNHTNQMLRSGNGMMLGMLGMGLGAFAWMKLMNNEDSYFLNKANNESSDNNDNNGPEGVKINQYTLSNIFEKVSPACVSIVASSVNTASGSGFVIDKEGTIVTCFHVIESSPYPTVVFSDGTKRQAKVVATDRMSDIAILKVDPKDLPKNLVPLEFETNNTRIGEYCLTVGANLGFSGSLNFGIVSAIRNPLEIEGTKFKVDYYLQTDLGINRGNSGSPLFNMNGKIIGMAILKVITGESLSFWIPSRTLSNIVDQLTKRGKVTRLFLGLRGFDLNPSIKDMIEKDQKTVPNVSHGVLVMDVFDNTPASESHLLPYDVIMEVEGKRIFTLIDLRESLGYQPGKKLNLKVARIDPNTNKTVILNKILITRE